MFQSWRFKLRKAEETLRDGRLDAARELLLREDLIEFLPGKRLAARLASRYAARALQHQQADDWKAAWNDLESAVMVGGETPELLDVRRGLVDAGLTAVEQRLAAADLSGAFALLDEFERRSIPQARLDRLRQVGKQLLSADKLAQLGKFGDAEAQLAAAIELLPQKPLLEERRETVRARRQLSRPLEEALHGALASSDWAAALKAADQLLEIAPESRIAKEARRKAWAEVGARDGASHELAMTIPWKPSVHAGHAEADAGDMQHSRFVLWVDGVGGYLVCLGDKVVLGQAQPRTRADVSIMADLSRRHAVICRGGEGYWVEPLHAMRVNGRAVQAKTILSDGDELELGSGVRIRFRRPHALSASARLEFVSGHRTQPSADGVLLMAESCVLGPNQRNHVICRDWSRDVVLYRHDEGLYCRAMESIEIDGELCDGRGRLAGNSRVVGSDFSMSLEELDRCSTQSLP